MTQSMPPVTRFTRAMYGVGSVAEGAKNVAFGAYLLIFYNQVMGVPASLVSLALLISVIIDAISNPILGQISDNLQSKWGRRHPFIYASALPTAILFYMMFNPPVGWSDTAMFWYILVISMLARVVINLYELPSVALTPELSDDYDERTKLMSWRYFFSYLGGLGSAFFALKVLLKPTKDYPVGQLNPDGYAAWGLYGAILIFVTILISGLGTHNRIKYVRPTVVQPPRSTMAHLREIIETVSHKGFVAIFGYGILVNAAAGLTGAMAVYFGTYVWELGPAGLAILTIDGIVSVTIALFVAPIMSRKFGKKPVAIFMGGLGVTIGLTPLALRQLDLFLPNEPERVLVWTLFSIQVGYGLMVATASILISSMIGDLVEDNAVKTGRHSSGVFYSASAFMRTCAAGLGVFFAGMLLEFSKFPEKATPGSVAPEVISTMLWIYIPVIATLWIVGMSCLNWYRIDRSTHEANLAHLASQETL